MGDDLSRRPRTFRGSAAQDILGLIDDRLVPLRDGSGVTSIAALSADGRVIIANSTVVAGGVPAKPGDVVTLYGTGFGYSNPVYQAGEIPDGQARLRDPFTISVGGTLLAAADILYAGLSPNSISGLYQFNVRLPAALADGDIPIVVTIGGVSSQARATIPVRR